MKPIMIKQPLQQNYFHSYGQDSPWFAAVSNGILLESKCTHCGFTTANPKLACQECYSTDTTQWTKLPSEGKIHAFTVCHFGAEASLDWIGMDVKVKFAKLSQLKPTDVYFVPK